MENKYLNNVLNSLVRETNIDFDEETLYMPFFNSFHAYPFESYYIPKFFHPSSTYSTPPSFTEHCRDIYGLNDDEIYYVWDEYKTIIGDKILSNKNTITESEKITVKDSIFLRKIIKYLKNNTKVVVEPFDIYDGYIIAPIGNGFRWDFDHKSRQPHGDFANEWWKEMLGVYGLSSKEVLIVMGVYEDFIWETLEKISDGR